MRLRNVLTAAAAVLFSALLSSSPARADFIFDLAVGPASEWTGSGSIDFTALSGTSTVDVAGFSFHVATGEGSPQDYALAACHHFKPWPKPAWMPRRCSRR
jgi:hypothetical protein